MKYFRPGSESYFLQDELYKLNCDCEHCCTKNKNI